MYSNRYKVKETTIYYIVYDKLFVTKIENFLYS